MPPLRPSLALYPPLLSPAGPGDRVDGSAGRSRRSPRWLPEALRGDSGRLRDVPHRRRENHRARRRSPRCPRRSRCPARLFGVALRSFNSLPGEKNHRAGRKVRRARRLKIACTRSRRKSAKFLGLWPKPGPVHGQIRKFSEFRKKAHVTTKKVLKRYGRLAAAPAAFRERLLFGAEAFVGLQTHEGFGAPI